MATYTPTKNTEDAIDAANDAVGEGSEYTGMCEQYTRTCYGFAAAYGSANEAYQAAKSCGGVHHSDGHDAPAGSVMFWDITYGTNAPYDHVAPVVATGVAASTSAGPGKTVARVKITDLTACWGMTPRGWTTIYHGVHLFAAPTDPFLEELMTWYDSKDEFRNDMAGLIKKYVALANVKSGKENAAGGDELITLSTATEWELDSLRTVKADLDKVINLLEK